MSKTERNPFNYKFEIGDTLEYRPKNGAKPRRAEVIGRRASSHPDDPDRIFDHAYVFNATSYLGDEFDEHIISEDQIIGKVK